MELKQFKHFINGEFVGSARVFDKRRPTDNALIGQIHEGGPDEIDAAVVAGRAALQGPWGRMRLEQRVDLLYKVADEIRVASTNSSPPRLTILASGSR